MEAGIVIGAGAGGMNGGLTNLVMGRSFEDGFIQGAMGGAVGGFVGYMIGLGLKGLSNDKGNGTASTESPASSEDLNFEDHLPDRGPGGVGYGGPGRTQKRVLKQAREYRNTKVVKSKPVVKASVSTPSLLVTASLAASYLMDALAAAAIPLAISPTVLIFPLAFLYGDEQERYTTNQKSLEDLKKGPPSHPGFKPPKAGTRKVKNPNGLGSGWIDNSGDVWVPTNHGGTHAPHWDRQHPDGSHTNVYPILGW